MDVTTKPSSGIAKIILKYTAMVVILLVVGYLLMDQVWPYFLNRLNSSPAAETKRANPETRLLPVENKPVVKEPIQLSPVPRKVQVEVLNGCGEKGVAKVVTDKLKQNDFDVINSGNYVQKGKINFDQPLTRIIDQLSTGDNKSSARDIARMIGVDTDLIESLQNPAPVADITIIIGKDYKSLKIFRND